MSNIKCIIIEDEPLAVKVLTEYVQQVPFLELQAAFKDAILATEFLRNNKIDLIFLDIHLPKLKGISFLKTLTYPLSVILTTAYHQYAVEGFNLNVTDYLLKPFDQERFRKTLARVRPRHLNSGAEERQSLLAGLLAQFERGARSVGEEKPRLLAEFGGHLHVLEATHVEMIEADRNYVVIRVGKDNFHARSTLQQAELALRSQPMLRISRSCLVNMNYIKEVNRTLRGDFILVLGGGATVTSSEGFRGKVKDYLSTLRIS